MEFIQVVGLELFDCAVHHREVVAENRNHLAAGRKVVHDKDVRMQVLDLGSHDYEAEDRKDLIGVKNPLLTFQTIHVVKLLDILVHHLRARVDDLHLVDGSHRFLQLVEDQLALTVGFDIVYETGLTLN